LQAIPFLSTSSGLNMYPPVYIELNAPPPKFG
jgi:hypothetical protein